jgi:hypothetical protein
MEPRDFELKCACKVPGNGTHEPRYCIKPDIAMDTQQGDFVVFIACGGLIHKEADIEEKQRFESAVEAEPADAIKIVRIPLDAPPRELRRVEKKYERAFMTRGLLYYHLPNMVADWWRSKRGAAFDEYVVGAGCACGERDGRFVHTRDRCFDWEIGFYVSEGLGGPTRVVLIITSKQRVGKRTTTRSSRYKLWSMPGRASDMHENPLRHKADCMVGMPYHAMQFWRRSSARKYRCVVERVLLQTQLGPFAQCVVGHY